MPRDDKLDHADVLKRAAEIGLSTKPPYDQELIVAAHHIKILVDRLARDWRPEDEPATSFTLPAKTQDT